MNIIKYVKKWGQVSFHKRPLNEVDSLILSCLSYFHWKEIVPHIDEDELGLFIGDILANKETLETLIKGSMMNSKKDRKLLLALMRSPRFSHLKLNYYQSIFNKDNSEQFAAVSFIYEDFFLIAFRGTDQTLTGWKEDFEMAILNEVPAQVDALNYVNIVASKEKLKNMKFYLSGHSKGGNLAMYAATKMNLDLKERLIMARSHDGPGFKDFDAHIDNLIPIINKTSSTVPYSSLIGTLLGFRRDSKIVDAKSYFILQHIPYTWKINKKTGDFVYLTYRSKTSYKAEISMTRFIHSLSEEEKKKFIDIVFFVLDNENNSLSAILKRPFRSMVNMRKHYKTLREEERQFVSFVLKRLKMYWKEAFLDKLTYRKVPIEKAYRDFVIFDEWS